MDQRQGKKRLRHSISLRIERSYLNVKDRSRQEAPPATMAPANINNYNAPVLQIYGGHVTLDQGSVDRPLPAANQGFADGNRPAGNLINWPPFSPFSPTSPFPPVPPQPAPEAARPHIPPFPFGPPPNRPPAARTPAVPRLLPGPCWQKFPAGTVIRIRHQEFSLDPNAEAKMRMAPAGTHTFEATKEGIMSIASRPAVVLRSFDTGFTYIPSRTHGGKGIARFSVNKLVKNLVLESAYNPIPEHTFRGPHETLRWMPDSKASPDSQISCLDVTDVHTGLPVETIRVLGRLCKNEWSRLNALHKAMLEYKLPSEKYKLNNQSIELYIRANREAACQYESDSESFERRDLRTDFSRNYRRSSRTREDSSSPEPYRARRPWDAWPGGRGRRFDDDRRSRSPSSDRSFREYRERTPRSRSRAASPGYSGRRGYLDLDEEPMADSGQDDLEY